MAHPPPRRATQSTTSRHECVQQSRAQVAKQARPKAIDFLSKSKGIGPAHSTIVRLQEFHDDESGDEGEDENEDVGIESEREEDIDAPRVAQWIDDEEFGLQGRSGFASLDSEGVDDGDDSASETGPSQKLQSLEDDLSKLPLGALRSAQRSLTRTQTSSDAEPHPEEQFKADFSVSEDDDSFPYPAKDKEQQQRHSFKSKSDLTKRTNKHAPAEVTSKRPVSRRRVVVDDKLLRPRDPRFMHAAGRYDPSKFKQQYDFLPGLRNDELSTLREHVKRAHKLLASSPPHLRTGREEEVKRLEHAMKRAESAVNLDNREGVELKALRSAKRTEKEKRNQGKAGWWMKRSEKKELLEKARLDAIASVGGKQAVKKAIEKKQKKIGQKEKKMRPFPRSEEIQSNGKRRRPAGPIDPGRGVKRHKVV